jgi:hypothetical protein
VVPTLVSQAAVQNLKTVRFHPRTQRLRRFALRARSDFSYGHARCPYLRERSGLSPEHGATWRHIGILRMGQIPWELAD